MALASKAAGGELELMVKVLNVGRVIPKFAIKSGRVLLKTLNPLNWTAQALEQFNKRCSRLWGSLIVFGHANDLDGFAGTDTGCV